MARTTGIFVTGTDTGVGKTVVAVALLRALDGATLCLPGVGRRLAHQLLVMGDVP